MVAEGPFDIAGGFEERPARGVFLRLEPGEGGRQADRGEDAVDLPVVRVQKEAVVGDDEGHTQGLCLLFERPAALAGDLGVVDEFNVEVRPVRRGGQQIQEVREVGETEQVRPDRGKGLFEGEISIQVTTGDDLAQVAVTPGISGQENDVLVRLSRLGEFYAEDGFDPGLPAGQVELDQAAHPVCIRERNSTKTICF